MSFHRTAHARRETTLSRRRLLASGGAFAMCASQRRGWAQTPEPDPQRTTPLRVAVRQLPGHTDPATSMSLEHIWLDTLMFDAPARWNADGEIFPSVSISWSIGTWDRVIDLYARPDAFFPDGRAVVADDVRWTLERIRAGGNSAQDAWRLENIWRIETINDRTVRLILDAPDSALLASLASPALSVMQSGSDLSGSEGGTGPYMIRSQSPFRVHYQRNPHFWQVGRPHIDNVFVRAIEDDTARSTALVTGAIDLIPNTPLLDVSMLQQDPSVTLIGGPSNRLCLLHVNLESSVLGDVRLRQLLVSAVNREGLVQVATAGQADATSVLFPREAWPGEDTEEAPERSPEEIRATLAELGIHSDLRLRLITNNADATLANTAVILQEQFAYGGIALSVELLEDDALQTAIRLGDYDLLADYTHPWRDPHELVRPLLASDGVRNRSGYVNPEVDGLIRGATFVALREVRANHYRRLQERVHMDVPVIVLFRPYYYDAMTVRLANYAQLPPVTSRGMLPATLAPQQ